MSDRKLSSFIRSGPELEAIRRSANLTEQKVAGRAGISVRTLVDIELGRRKPWPRVMSVYRDIEETGS